MVRISMSLISGRLERADDAPAAAGRRSRGGRLRLVEHHVVAAAPKTMNYA